MNIENTRLVASEPVCAGLSGAQLRQLELHHRLPGEAGHGHSVYRITFVDGAQYVGITKRGVVDRLEQHLGADPWTQDRAPPPLSAYRRALGTLAIVTRVAAGVQWSIEVIASGLEEQDARQREQIEIARLTRPLNGAGPVRGWSDPMERDPKYGAVARLIYGVRPPPPVSISAEELPQALSRGWRFLEPGPRPGFVRVTPPEGRSASPGSGVRAVPDSFSGRLSPDSMTNSNDATHLQRLADLIRLRNENEVAIARVIDRPALLGHIGEYIASRIFSIELAAKATNPGFDGWFRSSPLVGKSVDIKTYAKREGVLDIKPQQLPDYYLVLAGPKSSAESSRGTVRPWGIKEVFLFEAAPLVARLRKRPVKVGTATGVHGAEWKRARIFPVLPGTPLRLTKDQQAALRRFDLYG